MTNPRTDAQGLLAVLISTYRGREHELLVDLASALQLSLAYVDRATVEAHLERRLPDADWNAVAAEFHPLDFDDHVGDHGSFRTDWIETVLERAGVAGRDPHRDDDHADRDRHAAHRFAR